jgi:Protein of unknown function (DUF1569)
MNPAKYDFIEKEFIPLLQNLAADAVPNWGKMQGQQMVEHVTDFFKVSSRQLEFPLLTPEEQLPLFKAFLLSDKAFRENTKAPAAVLGEEPLPLKHADMQTAIARLQQSVDDFFAWFKEDPLQTTVHPVFGALNRDEWVQLHHKHVTHHLKQFGLL